MSSTATRRYRELAAELIFRRKMAGAALPADIESWFIEQLDDAWRDMTLAEQDFINYWCYETWQQVFSPAPPSSQD